MKTFGAGVLLGLIGSAVLLWYVPVVDQHREGSLITVQPNGGNSEIFQITLPRDRILGGFQGASETVPAALEWPQGELFADSQTELFKLRDRADTVIGIAGRIAANSTDPFVHWMLHLPARGTLFLKMQHAADGEAFRAGTLHAGTQEFAELSGTVQERYIGNPERVDFDVDSRIELTTQFVGKLQPSDSLNALPENGG